MRFSFICAVLIAVFSASVGFANEWYAAPNGTAAGDGAKDTPWDLQTALSQPASVKPGDTIWLRGGVYKGSFTSTLAGEEGKPIIVRQAPDEFAIIDGSLRIGAKDTPCNYAWFWGFEVTHLNNERSGPGEAVIVSQSSGVKLINLVVHDANSNGIGVSSAAGDIEINGCLVYYNGFQGQARTLGAGIVSQNQTAKRTIRDNIVFDQFRAGIEVDSMGHTNVVNYEIDGNIVFNSGCLSQPKTQKTEPGGGNHADNIGINGGGVPKVNIRVTSNYTYHTPENDDGYSHVGTRWDTGPNKDAVVADNYWMGGESAIELWTWDKVSYTGNTSYSKGLKSMTLILKEGQKTADYDWDKNTYFGAGKFQFSPVVTGEEGANQDWAGWKQVTGLDKNSTFTEGRPTGILCFVRGNKYEPGRADIVVYNWNLADSAQVDLSAVGMKNGDAYQIRDAQNFFGSPVIAGTYDGKLVAIPMKGLSVASALGPVPVQPKHTAPEFGAFVLTKPFDETKRVATVSVTETKPMQAAEGPEVLFLGPIDNSHYQKLFDFCVEYGVYVDFDAQENAPTELPADLSGYKVIVIDSESPLLKDPGVQARIAHFTDMGHGLVTHKRPKTFDWDAERLLWVYMSDILMQYGVRKQNPAFLERLAARPDKDVILNQAQALIKNEAVWIRVGNDAGYLRVQALWDAAELYNNEDLKKQVIGFLDELLAKKDQQYAMFSGFLLPMFKEPGMERFLNQALAQMATVDAYKYQALEYREKGPYFRCEEISGMMDPARFAGLLGTTDYLAPAIDIMKSGHDTLFMKDKLLWAHAGIRGRWIGLPWSRGQGWLLCGLVSLLENMPKDHPDYKLLQFWLEETAEGLRRTQDPSTGLWNCVVGEPTTRLEISGSAMIVRHFCHAWRAGVLQSPGVRDMITRAWKGVKSHTLQGRSCSQSYGTSAGYDVMFYNSIPASGSCNWATYAGAEYVKTFGPLVP